jgi:hypothetical protein
LELIGKLFGISYKKHKKSNFGNFCIIEFLEKRFIRVETFNPFKNKKQLEDFLKHGKTM